MPENRFPHSLPRILGALDRGTLRHFVFKEGLFNTFFTHCTSKDGSTLRATRKVGAGGQNCPACDAQDVTELTCNRAWVFCTKFGTNTLESINGSISAIVSKRSDFFVSHFGRAQLAVLKRVFPGGYTALAQHLRERLELAPLFDAAVRKVTAREKVNRHVPAGQEIRTKEQWAERTDFKVQKRGIESTRTTAALAGHKAACNEQPCPTVGQEERTRRESDKVEERAASKSAKKVATAAAKAVSTTAVRKSKGRGRGSARGKGRGGPGGGRGRRGGLQAEDGKRSAGSEGAPSSQKRHLTVEPHARYNGAGSSLGAMMREKRDEEERANQAAAAATLIADTAEVVAATALPSDGPKVANPPRSSLGSAFPAAREASATSRGGGAEGGRETDGGRRGGRQGTRKSDYMGAGESEPLGSGRRRVRQKRMCKSSSDRGLPPAFLKAQDHAFKDDGEDCAKLFRVWKNLPS